MSNDGPQRPGAVLVISGIGNVLVWIIVAATLWLDFCNTGYSTGDRGRASVKGDSA